MFAHFVVRGSSKSLCFVTVCWFSCWFCSAGGSGVVVDQFLDSDGHIQATLNAAQDAAKAGTLQVVLPPVVEQVPQVTNKFLADSKILWETASAVITKVNGRQDLVQAILRGKAFLIAVAKEVDVTLSNNTSCIGLLQGFFSQKTTLLNNILAEQAQIAADVTFYRGDLEKAAMSFRDCTRTLTLWGDTITSSSSTQVLKNLLTLQLFLYEAGIAQDFFAGMPLLFAELEEIFRRCRLLLLSEVLGEASLPEDARKKAERLVFCTAFGGFPEYLEQLTDIFDNEVLEDKDFLSVDNANVFGNFVRKMQACCQATHNWGSWGYLFVDGWLSETLRDLYKETVQLRKRITSGQMLLPEALVSKILVWFDKFAFKNMAAERLAVMSTKDSTQAILDNLASNVMQGVEKQASLERETGSQNVPQKTAVSLQQVFFPLPIAQQESPGVGMQVVPSIVPRPLDGGAVVLNTLPPDDVGLDLEPVDDISLDLNISDGDSEITDIPTIVTGSTVSAKDSPSMPSINFVVPSQFTDDAVRPVVVPEVAAAPVPPVEAVLPKQEKMLVAVQPEPKPVVAVAEDVVDTLAEDNLSDTDDTLFDDLDLEEDSFSGGAPETVATLASPSPNFALQHGVTDLSSVLPMARQPSRDSQLVPVGRSTSPSRVPGKQLRSIPSVSSGSVPMSVVVNNPVNAAALERKGFETKESVVPLDDDLTVLDDTGIDDNNVDPDLSDESLAFSQNVQTGVTESVPKLLDSQYSWAEQLGSASESVALVKQDDRGTSPAIDSSNTLATSKIESKSMVVNDVSARAPMVVEAGGVSGIASDGFNAVGADIGDFGIEHEELDSVDVEPEVVGDDPEVVGGDLDDVAVDNPIKVVPEATRQIVTDVNVVKEDVGSVPTIVINAPSVIEAKLQDNNKVGLDALKANPPVDVIVASSPPETTLVSPATVEVINTDVKPAVVQILPDEADSSSPLFSAATSIATPTTTSTLEVAPPPTKSEGGSVGTRVNSFLGKIKAQAKRTVSKVKSKFKKNKGSGVVESEAQPGGEGLDDGTLGDEVLGDGGGDQTSVVSTVQASLPIIQKESTLVVGAGAAVLEPSGHNPVTPARDVVDMGNTKPVAVENKQTDITGGFPDSSANKSVAMPVLSQKDNDNNVAVKNDFSIAAADKTNVAQNNDGEVVRGSSPGIQAGMPVKVSFSDDGQKPQDSKPNSSPDEASQGSGAVTIEKDEHKSAIGKVHDKIKGFFGKSDDRTSNMTGNVSESDKMGKSEGLLAVGDKVSANQKQLENVPLPSDAGKPSDVAMGLTTENVKKEEPKSVAEKVQDKIKNFLGKDEDKISSSTDKVLELNKVDSAVVSPDVSKGSLVAVDKVSSDQNPQNSVQPFGNATKPSDLAMGLTIDNTKKEEHKSVADKVQDKIKDLLGKDEDKKKVVGDAVSVKVNAHNDVGDKGVLPDINKGVAVTRGSSDDSQKHQDSLSPSGSGGVAGKDEDKMSNKEHRGAIKKTEDKVKNFFGKVSAKMRGKNKDIKGKDDAESDIKNQ